MVDELYCLYIAPWASAWGAFRFKAGLTRVGFRFFQVCALTRAGDFKFFQVLRPYAHKRFNVSRHSRLSACPKLRQAQSIQPGSRPNLGRLKGRLYIHLQSCDKLSQLKHGNRGAIAHDALCITDATICRIGACKTVLQALLRPGAFLRFKEGFPALCGATKRAGTIKGSFAMPTR